MEQVKWLNELEWIEGEVWGNIWQTECIARVSPVDGKVLGWILMDGLTQVHEPARLCCLLSAAARCLRLAGCMSVPGAVVSACIPLASFSSLLTLLTSGDRSARGRRPRRAAPRPGWMSSTASHGTSTAGDSG